MNIRFRHSLVALLAVCSLTEACAAFAAPAPFDLVGPTLVGTVTRGATTLPITKVPNLVAGDRLLLRTELPPTQSARYLMVAAFLRGPTNPPPASWFYRCETWSRACVRNGLALTVPKDAQQLLVFFAPQTGGDFKTLMSAVQGRPGAFVRAAQELNQAALDRSRLDQYLAGVRELDVTDPAKLKETAPLLARSLDIKVDEKCLDRIPALQAPCLMQGQESLILNDGHSASMVATLTSGAASDLAIQAGSTARLSSGAYLPYIGSIFDIARLLDSFHTAHYQYIPALVSHRDERLALMLNTPPSFHDPQSVLVAALPAIEQSQLPPLHALDAKDAYCAYKAPLVLFVGGAPLVFSTSYAHDLAVNVTGPDGKSVALPAHADAKLGGFVVDTSQLGAVGVGDTSAASLSGYWGFDKFEGPNFKLVKPKTRSWALGAGDEAALVAGREDTVHLQSGSVSCIEDIRLRDASGQESTIPWKVVKADAAELKLPLQNVVPGALTLIVRQYGAAEPQLLELNAFADAGHLDSFILHAGDVTGILQGSRLDQVDTLQFKGYEFAPGSLSSVNGSDQLAMSATDTQGVGTLKAGDAAKVKVRLKDGRTSALAVTVAAPRPRGELIATSVNNPPPIGSSNTIELSGADELPLGAKLAFSVRTRWPLTFTRDEQIEVATADQSFSVMLSVGNGGMTLESANVAVANLVPATAFGPSAFGPLQFRLIAHAVAGDWQRLATLVRLPVLEDLRCPSTAERVCQLFGTNLFLLDSIANDPQFTAPVQVPDGFPGFSLVVPRPIDGRLYVKLRDNSTVINVAVFALPPTASATDAVTRPDVIPAAEAPDVPSTSQPEKTAPQNSGSAQDAKE